MKKVIILAGLLLAMAHVAFAEQRGVFMEFHRKSNPEKNMEVNRAPMHLPIKVVYDSDAHNYRGNRERIIRSRSVSLQCKRCS